MKPKQLLCLWAAIAGLVLASSPAQAQLNFAGVDLGGPSHAGSATVNPDSSVTINGGGSDIWNNADQCFYYYTWASGSTWSAQVHVLDLNGGTDAWSKTELMVRNSNPNSGPAADDPMIANMVAVTQNQVGLQFRSARADGAADNGGYVNFTVPDMWMKISRTNSVFTLAISSDGTHWTNTYNIDTASSTPVNGHVFGAAWPDAVTVGIAVTAHNDGNISGVNGTVANLSATFPAITAPTAAAAVVQVQNASTRAGSEASFSFRATNNASPNVVNGAGYVSYQWSKNGTAIPGATSTVYTFLAATADGGAQYTCRYSILPPYNTTVDHLDSAPGVLTVNAATYYTNGLKQEFFAGQSRPAVENGNVSPTANISVVTPTFEGAQGLGNNYARRISGWFIAPATQRYIFVVASDDDCDLYLSTDADPAHKRIIAQETAWCGNRSWGNPDGGSQQAIPTQARSDMWTPDLNFPTFPFADGIQLSAGSMYYIEAVMHQGTGGDNIAVTYMAPATNTVAGESYTPAPTNGTAPAFPAGSLVLASFPATQIGFAQQPANVLTYEQRNATFTSSATNNGEFVSTYQWYRNGNQIAGATGSAYSFTVGTVAQDNGAQFFVVASTAEDGLSVTSRVASLTVQAAIFEPGFALLEDWRSNPGRAAIETGTAGLPGFSMLIPAAEGGVNNGNGDNYCNAVSGLFVPPTTGNYVFFCCGDDQVDMFLSTDDTPNNKHLIAQETGWSNPRIWNSSGDGSGNGGSVIANKRSDTFAFPATPPYTGATPWPGGNTIHLNAGQKYWYQLVHNDGTGGDSVEATYIMEGTADPANGSVSTMTGSKIGVYYAPPATFEAFSNAPVSTAVASATTATFTALGGSDGSVPVGTTGQYYNNGYLTFPFGILYQWFRNGTAIAGATTTTFTTPLLLPSNNGDQYTVAIRALGYPTWLTSSPPAILTVITDSVPPTVTFSAIYTNSIMNTNGGFTPPQQYVSVTFSKRMDISTLTNPANYSIAGATVTGVTVDSGSAQRVLLSFTGTPTVPLTVTVSNVRSFSGIAIVPTGTAIGALNLTFIDIGVTNVDVNTGLDAYDPAYPSVLYIDNTNAYTVTSEGSDIWNAADGCSFLYEPKSGDFDVVVRVTRNGHTSQWAKAGLMARETLDAGSRDWNVIADPAAADGIMAPDNSGLGANTFEANSRTTPDTASNADWGGNTGTGGRSGVPVYPNAWVRLKRTGNVFDGYWSSNSITWTHFANQDATAVGSLAPLPPLMYIGICTTAHNNDTNNAPVLYYQNTASYDNYNSSFVASAPPATLTTSYNNATHQLTISWTPAGGRLLHSPAIFGAGVNWQPVTPATNPVSLPASAAADYFRVVNP